MRTILIVDGYNAIHAIDEARRIFTKDMKAARQELLRLCRAFKKSSGYIDEVKVVFDGKGNASSTDPASLRGEEVIFSSSSGADGLLIEMARDWASDNRVLLVSRDNFVRNNCRGLGAELIDPSILRRHRKKNSFGISEELTNSQKEAVTREYRKALEKHYGK